MTPSPTASVVEQYRGRLEALQRSEAGFRRRDRIFIALKIVAGIITLCLAVWLAKYQTSHIFYVLLPMFVIVALFALHERVLTDLRNNSRLQQHYELGLGRLHDRWFTPSAARSPRAIARSEMGEQYLDPAHLYARDLDLFGPGSLYHLLCTVRTRTGQDTLAAWLLAPATVAEIELRQEAVRELAPLFEFRERLALAGSTLTDYDANTGATPEAFARWAESSSGLGRHLRVQALVAALLWVASIAAWQMLSGSPLYFLAAVAMSVVNLAIAHRHRHQLHGSAASIAGATGDIDALAEVLAVLESQAFTSRKLRSLMASLQQPGSTGDRSGAEPVSNKIARLNRRLDWFSSHDNWFVKVLDPLIFFTLQCVLSIEDWRRLHGPEVRTWLSVIGEMEALTALSVYASEHPDDVFPDFTDQWPFFHAEGLAHPLLPCDGVVRNTLHLDRHLQLLVISGPNMAGKSTFIRSVGVNAVLAQAGAPVRARKLTLSPLAVAASICVLDSLQGGLSRFYAEILRLKDIDALTRQHVPVLFLLDELLSGTNSHDRRIGTESLVRSLVGRNAVGLVTTHDLALAAIADRLQGRAANYHFEDRYEDGELHFEYKLTPGTVQTSNALQLMRSIGLEV